MAESTRTVPARPNVYTVLAIVATVALAVAIGFVWTSNLEMTRHEQQKANPGASASPWYIVPATPDQASGPRRFRLSSPTQARRLVSLRGCPALDRWRQGHTACSINF